MRNYEIDYNFKNKTLTKDGLPYQLSCPSTLTLFHTETIDYRVSS